MTQMIDPTRFSKDVWGVVLDYAFLHTREAIGHHTILCDGRFYEDVIFRYPIIWSRFVNYHAFGQAFGLTKVDEQIRAFSLTDFRVTFREIDGRDHEYERCLAETVHFLVTNSQSAVSLKFVHPDDLPHVNNLGRFLMSLGVRTENEVVGVITTAPGKLEKKDMKCVLLDKGTQNKA